MKKKLQKVIKTLFKYFILIIILIGLILIIRYKINNSSSSTYTPPLTNVKVEKAKLGTIEKSLTFPTYIEASDIIPVIPFVQGKILKYNIKVGDYVYKDQIIAEIDSTALDQQVLQAEAAYNAYKNTFERIESLFNKKATSAQNYDEAKAMLDASKAQLELIKVQRDYTIVRAPISGTVLSAPLAIGNIASSQNPLAIIANLESQIVNIEINEKYYDIIYDNRYNLTIELNRPDSDSKIYATSISIDPYIQPQSKVFILKAKLNGDLTYFRPGMYTIAKITYKTINNIYVLNQGIKKLDGSLYYYDENDKKAHYLEEELFSYLDENDEYFQIPNEYKDYYFIVDGQSSVYDNQKVNAFNNYSGDKL